MKDKEDSDIALAFQAEQARQERLSQAGLTGPQIARRVLEMVGALHERGFESLYLDAQMAPSGMYWRYQIGAILEGPVAHESVWLRSGAYAGARVGLRRL